MSLAVCAIVKDEGSRIQEWLDFHRRQGVDHFVLYDNDSSDDTRMTLLRQGGLDYTSWPGAPNGLRQIEAYVDAIVVNRGRFDWLAFIDVDEFLFSPRGRLPDVLEERYADCDAVGACWAMYGTSGILEPPPSVVESFVWRARRDSPANLHIKTILRPDRCAGPGGDAHHFQIATVDEQRRPMSGPYAQSTSWEWLRINHYWPRSIREAEAKAARPRIDMGPDRTLAELCAEELNEVYDPILAEAAE